MAETSHEIRRQIDDTRARIGSTIAALERKMDPHRVLDEHPLTLVGAAFGAGVLLATSGATGRAVQEVREQVRHGANNINDRAGDAFDGIVQAIVGAATAAVTAKFSELVDASLGASSRTGAEIPPRRALRGRAA